MDLIDRQAAIDALFALYEYQRSFDPTEAADLVRQGIFLAEKKIEKLPSTQSKENCCVHINDIYRLISGHSNYHGDNILAALTCLAEGKEVPNRITTLDAQPERKKGKWIPYLPEGLRYKCSECESRYDTPWHFCPNCGSYNGGGHSENN